jgi:hypothetical protein
MKTQRRLSTQPAPASKKLLAPANRAQVRSAPITLDAQALKQVSGGTSETQGPYKTW